MAGVAVFLGAGASAALGLPTTNQLFPMIVERLSPDNAHSPVVLSNDKERRVLLKALNAIFPGLPNVKTDQARLPSITDVLSAIDYHLLSQTAPSPRCKIEDLDDARFLLERAIAELLTHIPPALEEAIASVDGAPSAAVREALQQSSGSEGVARLVDWLERLKGAEPLSIISTNYDIEVDQEIFARYGFDIYDRIDFGTRVRDPGEPRVFPRPETPSYRIHKLHGSLNWLRCDACEDIYLNPFGPISMVPALRQRVKARAAARWKYLVPEDADQCYCGYRPLRHVLVAPSYVRDVRDPVLLEIWRSAFDALRAADRWIIVGYSLTPEDVAIRALLLRAYAGRSEPPEVDVVQHLEKEPELSRYALMFPRHRFFGSGLESYLAQA